MIPNKRDLEEVEEERKRVVVTTMYNMNEISRIYEYFSKYWDRSIQVSIQVQMQEQDRGANLKQGELTVEEIEKPKKKLIRLIQQELFQGNNNRLAMLSVVHDEKDILCVEAKVSRTEDSQMIRYPYILPG